MIYTFCCLEEEKGCGHIFEVVMSLSDYTSKQVCPKCKKTTSVHRSYISDIPSTSVKLGDDEITVGHLANRNRDRFSDEQKAHLNYKHNEYKLNRPKAELPSGMRYLERGTDGEFLNFKETKKPKRTLEEKIKRLKKVKKQ